MNLFEYEPPSLPYAGTSGWSGSDTSEERARTQDADGTTSERQQRALRLVRFAEAEGLTWRELSNILNVHHGSASGLLSVLHKDGRIARLAERRDRCKVYVLPQFVAGRETEPHSSAKVRSCPNCGHHI